jgi:hypothetical protein
MNLNKQRSDSFRLFTSLFESNSNMPRLLIELSDLNSPQTKIENRKRKIYNESLIKSFRYKN